MKHPIILSLIFASLLLINSYAFSMQAFSDTQPARLTKCRGLTQYAYNIQEVDGIWTYDYVEIDGKVTVAKIKEAMRLAKNEDQALDLDGIETDQTQIEEKLAEIAEMSYVQIDAHIDNTFSGLSEIQRGSLKKLYKSVLALIKQLDLD